MKTIAENEALSKDEKINQLKEAKGGTWYDNWKPFCLTCSAIIRMNEKSYGFQCQNCKNMIGFDLTRLKESPLN